MIQQKDRIEAAIRHIQTATDVDPWAMELAVDALEKQIPKKPKMPFDACWICPICGSRVEHTFKHCRRCGQAIDWGTEE